MTREFTETQRRALAIATVVALAFVAYPFNPVFDWFLRRSFRGLSVTFILLAAIFAVIVPLGLLAASRSVD